MALIKSGKIVKFNLYTIRMVKHSKLFYQVRRHGRNRKIEKETNKSRIGTELLAQ